MTRRFTACAPRAGQRSRGESCGVVAVVHRDQAAQLVHRALFALQHRGQEGAGIAVSGVTGAIQHARGSGLVGEALPTERVAALSGTLAIGHCRYSTIDGQDDSRGGLVGRQSVHDQPVHRQPIRHQPIRRQPSANLQPLVATTRYGPLALAHNGNLKNASELRASLIASGRVLATSMDTELLLHLIATSEQPTFAGALRWAADRVVGAYSLTMIVGGRLMGLRDPFGVRPLCLGRLDGGWILASETSALDAVGATLVREVTPGELVTIGPGGVTSEQALTPAATPAPCVFELVYFARPDSRVFDQSVYGARVRMGEELAGEESGGGGRSRPGQRQDDGAFGSGSCEVVVVPIPDSGVPAAIGYSRARGLPFAMAITRSHHVGRTFLLPDQDARTSGIRLKLSVIPSVVRGKVVVLVDDSIVRGNTAHEVVRQVLEAGAKEVRVRIASPPIAWPCYLGIDTPERGELAVRREESVEGVARAIGVTDLRYLSLEGLRRATRERSFCFACMDGAYPV